MVHGDGGGACECVVVRFVFVDPVTLDTTLVPLSGLAYPAFLAGSTYETLIFAFEQYFNYDDPNNILEDRVPVTDGQVTISNGLGNETGSGIEYDEVLDLNSPDGSVLYPFIGGQPEFTGMGLNEESFTKTFDLKLTTPKHIVLWRPNNELFRGYVLGSKPVEGSSFVTQGPEIVDLILRDPPGDASYSSFVEEESYSNTQSWFTNVGASVTSEIKIKTGSEFLTGGGLAGIGFTTKTQTSIIGGFSVTGSFSASGDYTGEKHISSNNNIRMTCNCPDKNEPVQPHSEKSQTVIRISQGAIWIFM